MLPVGIEPTTLWLRVRCSADWAKVAFDLRIQSIPEVQNGIKRFEQKIVIHTRFTLLYLLAYGCFIVGNYDNALDLLQPILQEKETKVVEDIQFGARMLQMLCFFEKNEMLLVLSFIQSLRKTMLQKKLNLPVHKLVIKHIQQASKGKLNSNMRRNLKNQLNMKFKLPRNPNLKL